MKMLTTSYALYEIHGNKGKHLSKDAKVKLTLTFFAVTCSQF